MTRLILTTSDSGGGCLKRAGVADIVIPFGPRFVWGPLPPEAELASLLAARPTRNASASANWLDVIDRRHRQEIEAKGLGFIAFCATCDSVEIWVDPQPNAQLLLIWPVATISALTTRSAAGGAAPNWPTNTSGAGTTPEARRLRQVEARLAASALDGSAVRGFRGSARRIA